MPSDCNIKRQFLDEKAELHAPPRLCCNCCMAGDLKTTHSVLKATEFENLSYRVSTVTVSHRSRPYNKPTKSPNSFL